jgi:20S proteasome alpha/beta subunit
MFISIICIICQVAVVASSTFDYTSVTALDKYGNSVQLQHAHEAAARHGMPVVAATFLGGVVVTSIHKSRPGVSSQPTLIQTLSLQTPFVGVVCTGLKADAKWLVSTIRECRKRNWETYDISNISRRRSQEVIAQALLAFMGYDHDKELHDGLVVDSEDSWARPLGIQTMLVSADGPIMLVHASGAAQHFHAQAIGKHSREINAKLEERYKTYLTMREVQEMLIGIMNEVFVDGDDDSEFLVEILTTDGVMRSRIQRP